MGEQGPTGPGSRSTMGEGRLVDDAGADRDRDGLRAVVGAELLEDPLQVRLDRVRRDPEIRGDLASGGAVGHSLQDLSLALRERRRARLVGGRRPRLFDEGLGEVWVDHGVALDRVARGVDQSVGRGVLQEVAGHPRLDRLGHGPARFVHGDQDHLGVGRGVLDAACGLDPVHAGHPHVHEDDVGAEVACLLDGLLARARLADDHDHVVGQFERRPQTLSGHGVVIDDQRADLLHYDFTLRPIARCGYPSHRQAYAHRLSEIGMSDDITTTDTNGADTQVLTEERIRQALTQVYDPELGINIIDLGLVYDIDLHDNGDVDIRYSLTTMGCPIGPLIEDQIRAFLAPIEGLGEVRPELVFRPAWSPEMMSEEAKAALGIF